MIGDRECARLHVFGLQIERARIERGDAQDLLRRLEENLADKEQAIRGAEVSLARTSARRNVLNALSNAQKGKRMGLVHDRDD